MHDVKDGLGVRIMSDLVRKEIHDILETRNQIRKYKRREKELDNGFNSTFMYVRSYLMSRIVKTFRGEKQIYDFRSKLGLRLHDTTMSKE